MQSDKPEPSESKGAECPSTGDHEKKAMSNVEAETDKPRGISAVAVLWTFGKCLGALLPVYLAGYYRVSTSLLVFGMMIYTGWKHAREGKETRLKSAIQLLDNEQEYTSTRVSKIKRDLPAWVNFPDVEKVEWLNKVLQQVWPFVGQYLEKLLVETIAPSIRASSSHLQTLSFTKVDMGDKAMKVVGIKAHTENDKGQVLLDLYISYVGNVEINVEVKRYFCKAGVKGIQLHGMMRVILEPLIGDVPIVGAVSMFFIRRPKLDINWTGLTNLLDIPGLNVMSDSMIMDAIASFLVLPNRLVVPLVPGLPVAQLRSPLPRGVVRIHLLEAQKLVAKDNYVKGVMAGLSDPYAILRVGPQTFTSKHIDNTDAPKWGEMYEVIVHEVPGQELEVEVYDKDPDKDDFLGRTKLDLGIVKKSIVVDDWFTLKDTDSGRVHFRLEWLSLLPSTDQLEQVLKRNESITNKNADLPSSAILVIYLDKAEALPDPRNQDIDIQVKDADRVQTLGNLAIPLSRLLSNSNLSLDQWFQLENSGSASRIYINAILRVLWLDEERIPSDVSSSLSQQLSQQTSPHPSFATEGLLRIHLLAGQNLVPKDNLMGGMVKGKSDPYVKISIGGETFTSEVIKGNLNPTWNEMYEVILTQLPGQDLHVEVFDKDMDMKDDFMGRLKISLKDLIDAQYTDQLSHSWTLPMGSVVIPIRELLSEPELVLDQWFHLDGASPESQILLRTELKMLIPSKCPVTADKTKVTAVSDPSPAKQKQETEKTLKSSSVDTPPVETIVSSVTSHEDADAKKEAADSIPDETEEESPSPAITQPPHTSPDISFASEGLLRIILLEAQSLVAKDKVMGMAKGKSDPYAKISVGEESFKSNVIKENLNPVWNEMYEVVLRPQSGQEMQVELYDKDMDKDDFLGRFKISVADIISSQYLDQWYTLNDVKSGRVRLILEWVSTVSHNNTLDQVMHLLSLQSYQNKAVPCAALLFVYVDRAHSLPFKKSGKEPKAGAELVFGNTVYKTKVCDRTSAPQWNEGFCFKVHNPKEEMLIIKLSSAWDQPMGSLVVPVRQLLSEPQLVLDQWMPLDGALPESEILLRAELKILNSRMDEVPRPTVTTVKKEDTSTHTEKASAAAGKEEKSSEMPTHKSVAVSNQPKEPEANPATATEMAPHVEPAHDPSPAAALVDKPAVAEEQRTQPHKADRGDFEPQKKQTEGLGNLAHATVAGLPSDTKKPEVVPEIPKPAQVLPPHTTPSQGFAQEGLLRIHLLEAQNLVAKDNLMGGMVKGKSDPYVKINVGEVTLFSIKLNEVIRSQYTDQWYTLKDVKSGQVHLILEWVPAVSNTARLEQVLQLQSLQAFKNKAVPAAALLFVHIDRAHSLSFKKSGKEPKAGAELVLGETAYKTKLCDRSTSPQWNESFYFVVHDPKHDMLVVKLSSGWDQPMGSLVIPVKNLLAEPQLVQDQWFHLDGASPESQILLRAELKILASKMTDLIGAGTLPCAASGCGSGNGQVKLSLSYASQERKLIVIVHACRGLLSQHKDGVDSYVSLMLLPDKSKATKKKTGVKKRDLNPEFNERFEYDLPKDEIRFRRLSVSVKNNSASFRSRDVIGQVQLELAEVNLVSGVTEWFTLKDEAE
ncbi:extended synaptotagmin-1 [Neolamprologus brichardi]|uniref:extended synaptotagmin-1 n=1 Tax=Neolamprologus brichardi TaxID=32507 RepID=UPI00164391CE|nr:extended synaptotagmin-1 [Neolamprologus brichardi]